MGFFNNMSRVIGIDLQAHIIRFICLNKQKNEYVIESMVAYGLPSTIFAEGKIVRFHELKLIISDECHRHRWTGLPTVLALPMNLVRTQRMTVPKGLSAENIEAEIEAQVKRDLPGMVEELCIDFCELPSASNHDMEIFSIVARKEYLFSYVNCVNAAGLKAKIVDVEAYALKRAIEFSLLPLYQKQIAAVYFCEKNGCFMVFDEHEIIFHHYLTHTDLSQQFTSILELFHAMFPENKLAMLAICGDEELLVDIVKKNLPETDIYFCKPFEKIKNKGELTESLAAFLPALGLALRAVPLW